MKSSEKQESFSNLYGSVNRSSKVFSTIQTNLTIEEKALALFQPDILISAQYFATTQRKLLLEPEKKLMLAILEDAVACFQKYLVARHTREKALFRDSEAWFLEEDSQWIFSFEHICEILGFNPDYLRRGLLEWKSMQLSRQPKAQFYRLRPKGERKRPGLDQPVAGKQRFLKASGY